MTLKEAILKSLDDLNKITNYMEVYNHIVANKYYDFKDAKTPPATVSAILGDFIRQGDTRVSRIKVLNGSYSYYLTKNEQNVDLTAHVQKTDETKSIRTDKVRLFEERDLHILLSSYLKSTGIYSKTIFHEQSRSSKESHQIWTHPDMVGIRFLTLKTKASRDFLMAINRVDTFKLSSYEIKKEINNDSELKKAFFQAVSNSSWANYGYLVAFEFSDGLADEIERLNQSFGIGIIKLSAYPFQSKVIYQPIYRELDFKTIDKLCRANQEFEKFIEHSEKLMTAEERFHKAIEKEFDEFCDDYFESDSQIEKYCKVKNIPYK